MTSEINRYYRTLELEPGASLEQVKQSWRELVQVWHPDRFPNDSKLQQKAQERLKDINGAYAILERYLTSGTPPPHSRSSSSQTPDRTQQQSSGWRESESKRAETPPPPPPPPSSGEQTKTGPKQSQPFVAWTALRGIVVVFGVGGAVVVFGVIGLVVVLLRIAANSGDGSARTPSSRAPSVQTVPSINKAADIGGAQAQFELGGRYDTGEGVTKDWVEAAKWYRKAAEQNHAEAQSRLGVCYAVGKGVVMDGVEAVKWFRKAAEQNDAAGQRALGYRYSDGGGVTKDYVEAVKWWRKAAEQNDAKAQDVLGYCYNNGQGVVRDPVEAYKWYLLAAAQGDEDAKEGMPELEKLMTREEIAEGQERARSFKPR